MRKNLTKKRVAALQAKLLPFGISFTRSHKKDYTGIFSLLDLPPCIVSPVFPVIRCGMALIENTEKDPMTIVTTLRQTLLSCDDVEKAAY